MKESGGEKWREREIHAHRSEIRSYCPPHLPLPFTISISQLHSPTRPEEIPCVPSREGAKTHKALKPSPWASCPVPKAWWPHWRQTEGKGKASAAKTVSLLLRKVFRDSCFTQRWIINSSQNKNKMLKSHLAKGVLPMHQDTSSTWLIQKHSGSFFPLVSRGVRAPQHCSTHRPGLRPRPKFKLYMKGCHATQLALYSESKPNINWRKRFSLLFCFAYA